VTESQTKFLTGVVDLSARRKIRVNPRLNFYFREKFCILKFMQNRIEVFKQMIEADPSNTTVLFGLANEYQKSEDWQNVIATLEDYLSKAADEGAAYGMLAKAYERTGNREKAKAVYEKGIEVSLENGHPSMANDYRMTLDLDFGD
jgi:predicted Zn-dependent protease